MNNEASDLLAFVALAIFIATVALWAHILGVVS